MELGEEVDPNDIISLYNEIVEEGTPLVSYSEYGTEGKFYNEDDDEIPTDVILDELNYAIGLDGEKFLLDPEDDYKSLWINLAEELWVKFEKWLSEKDFELYDGGEDLHRKFIEVASNDEISYEEKSTEIAGYLEDKWGLYDGYEQTRDYLDFLFLEENNLENNENS
jgi:hypothetical protein